MKLDNYFGIHEQALKLRERRSEVLASNLANMDTPGYKARDFDFKALLARETGQNQDLFLTNQRHISTGDALVPESFMRYRMPEQDSLDGNSVNAEREQMNFASNSLQYQASLRFLGDKMTSLVRAIKGDG